MRRIIVVEYEEQWHTRYEAERGLLQNTLGKVISQVHHIGSTSIPGLSAKPIIDILLEVYDLDELDKLNFAMERAGYCVRGENGISNRRYFTKGEEHRSHHVHAFGVGNPQIVKHLAFRDYLRKIKKEADEYAEIKHAAALASEDNIPLYSTLKADFIAHHLRLALRDYK